MTQPVVSPAPPPRLPHSGAVPPPPPASLAANNPAQGPSHDELVRIFNTALVSSQSSTPRDFSQEIFELMENPAFRAILGAVRQLARQQGVAERQAAEQVIATFRKMDKVWSEYVFREGVERLKT